MYSILFTWCFAEVTCGIHLELKVPWDELLVHCKQPPFEAAAFNEISR